MENYNTICPLCGSQRSNVCWEEKTLAVNYSEDVFKTDDNEYRLCQECGLIYLYPRPDEEALKNYYSNVPVSHISTSALEDYKKPEYDHTVNFIRSNINIEKSKIVEVGAASGDLLRRLEQYTTASVQGVEASKECCDYANGQFGINMINGVLESIDLSASGLTESADLVICCHTLEHIIEPSLFLEKLSQIMNPTGLLYIEVPSTRLLATFENPRYGRNIHHLHLNHFISSSLSLALTKIGLSPILIYDDVGTNYPSLKAIFSKQDSAVLANDYFLKQITIQNRQYKIALESTTALVSQSKEKIVLWGAGQDLFYVLQDYPESFPASRVTLVDKNPQKQGKLFCGMMVGNPLDLEWDEIDQIIITPSNQMLQFHIQEDIDQLSGKRANYTHMFPINPPDIRQ
jgi:SAM-dependent methyltransferase